MSDQIAVRASVQTRGGRIAASAETRWQGRIGAERSSFAAVGEVDYAGRVSKVGPYVGSMDAAGFLFRFVCGKGSSGVIGCSGDVFELGEEFNVVREGAEVRKAGDLFDYGDNCMLIHVLEDIQQFLDLDNDHFDIFCCLLGDLNVLFGSVIANNFFFESLLKHGQFRGGEHGSEQKGNASFKVFESDV